MWVWGWTCSSRWRLCPEYVLTEAWSDLLSGFGQFPRDHKHHAAARIHRSPSRRQRTTTHTSQLRNLAPGNSQHYKNLKNSPLYSRQVTERALKQRGSQCLETEAAETWAGRSGVALEWFRSDYRLTSGGCKSDRMEMRRGVPPGSVLGPLWVFLFMLPFQPVYRTLMLFVD